MTRFPLSWPAGWRRSTSKKDGKFGIKKPRQFGERTYMQKTDLSLADGVKRVLAELKAMGVRDGDCIISTNVELRNDGLPYSGRKAPADPGAAVYWKIKSSDSSHRVMAIDLYGTVADNLAAIAATLSAMRAIERHGGAMILERAFMGFTALPAPNSWRAVMEFTPEQPVTIKDVRERFRTLAQRRHPDVGGSEAKMKELNWAMAEAERELSQ